MYSSVLKALAVVPFVAMFATTVSAQQPGIESLAKQLENSTLSFSKRTEVQSRVLIERNTCCVANLQECCGANEKLLLERSLKTRPDAQICCSLGLACCSNPLQ